ncbi:hypothetical protein ACVW2L_003023 [Mucilaginibacter sp. HD30]
MESELEKAILKKSNLDQYADYAVGFASNLHKSGILLPMKQSRSFKTCCSRGYLL